MNLVRCNNSNWRRNHPVRVFSDLLDEFFTDDFIRPMSQDRMVPSVNVSETDREVRIEMALPGMKKDDVQLTIDGNNLVVQSRVKEEKEDKKKGYLHREFYAGSFSRSFHLPDNFDASKIEARFENGMLEVEIPKKESDYQSVREIKVK